MADVRRQQIDAGELCMGMQSSLQTEAHPLAAAEFHQLERLLKSRWAVRAQQGDQHKPQREILGIDAVGVAAAGVVAVLKEHPGNGTGHFQAKRNFAVPSLRL